MELAGIEHRFITTMNPRANGQAERTVRSIKEGITRCIDECRDARWWEVLGDVSRGLRLSLSKATGHSPYHLVFKQQPMIPFLHAIETNETSLEDFTVENIEESLRAWKK